jgi:2-amino-4-hydroxy-6-hydroxymethyldihydropteridine diphosphokinase
MKCYIGLGSNLNDPQQQLTIALQHITHIPHTLILKTSRFYCNPALIPEERPDEIQPDYYNAVTCIDTELNPEALLIALQKIETVMGRVRTQRWLARIIDLDILLYGDLKLDLPHLKIPHPEMNNREFVLIPLAELTM